MNILGINAYHGDASACVVVEGRLVAAVEEERLRRVKHWAGFPSRAVAWCLEAAGLRVADLDHVAIGRNPRAHLLRKAAYTIRARPGAAFVADRLKNRARVRSAGREICEAVGADPASLRARVHHVEHHCAHLASCFFVSPFDEATCVSIDGFGDFVSTMIARGAGSRMRAERYVAFPHSLGAFYTAGTQYLGFGSYGDEYKVMGLAPYGEPAYLDTMREIVRERGPGLFELDTRWFRHPHEITDVRWGGGAPELGPYFSERWSALLGPAREREAPIETRHNDLARSLQARYEEVATSLIDDALNGNRRGPAGRGSLCLAGGCAYNSVANGSLLEKNPRLRLYVPPAAGDAGTAMGAAFWVWHQVLGRPRDFTLDSAGYGPEYDRSRVQRAVEDAGLTCRWTQNEEDLLDETARLLDEGAVVGWFQGRGEWGPRALGHRSILADPRRAEMKSVLNERIKKREPFRPFAPSVLASRVSDWFESAHPSPFMTHTTRVKAAQRARIPAVTHVDGSARPQTVTPEANPRFERLLRVFEERTGVPVLLNTSFNENEPIVHTPEEAIDCFRRTRMDALVIGDAVLRKSAAS